MVPEAVVDWLRNQKDNLSYCIWGAIPENEQQVHTALQSTIIFLDRQLPAEFNLFSSGGTSGVDDLSEMCEDTLQSHQEEIHNLNLSAEQNLFIACGWCTNKERHAFRLSPDVIKIDVTEGTNMEKRPLLTVSIRSAFGNYVVIARLFLSHQRRVSFRWAFSIALPRLLGDVSMVKAVMTDGDSNEIFELEEAIARWMPKAFRMRCAWHIIFKGWQRNCSGLEHAVQKSNRKRFKQIATAIKKYCYTFCWPGVCESKEELYISKCLLLAFINSKTVRNVVPRLGRKKIIDFLVEKVFIHDSTISMAHKKFVRCHNEVTNSSHEGTNYALKWHSAPVLPGQPLGQSAQTLQFQSEIKMNHEARIAAREVEATPTHQDSSTYPTSKHLTELCHELVVDQWKLGRNYVVKRMGSVGTRCEWLVVKSDKGNSGQAMLRALHPVWRRVRTVHQSESGRLKCSCGHFERCAYPCRHQAAVIMLEDRSCAGFSHHDVAIMWWKKVAYFGMQLGTQTVDKASEDMVDECVQQLMSNDVDGPRVRLTGKFQEVELSPEVESLFEEKSPEASCLNFTVDQIRLAKGTFGTIFSSTASGVGTVEATEDVGFMSQESHVSIGNIVHGNDREIGVPLFPWIEEDDNEENFSDSSSSMDEDPNRPLDGGCETNRELEIHTETLSVASPTNEGLNPSEFIQRMKEEIQTLEGLVRSRNFCPDYVNMQGCLDALKQTNSTIRSKMAAAVNHNKGQNWVSVNVAMSTSNKRQKGSEFGITKFH
jgi:hypothetical protein